MDASNNRDNSNSSSRKAMAMAENITNNGVSLPLNGFRIFLFKL
jgi:subtilase family serine protease